MTRTETYLSSRSHVCMAGPSVPQEGADAARLRLSDPLVDHLVYQVIDALGWTGVAHADNIEIQNHALSTTVRLQLVTEYSRRIVWIKLPHIKPDNADFVRDRMHAEFRILRELDNHFSDRAGLAVVTPIAVLAEPVGLVTEETPGETFQKVLVKGVRLPASTWRRSRIFALSHRCGQWLRAFHEITRNETIEAKWDETLVYCEQRLSLLVTSPYAKFDHKITERIRNKIVENIEKMRRMPNAVCGRHNDFAGHNIIVTGPTAISVLDFSMFDYDSPAFDYYSFIHKIDALRYDPLITDAVREKVVTSFKEGYGDISEDMRMCRDIVYCRLSLAKFLTLTCNRSGNVVKRKIERRREDGYRVWLERFGNRRVWAQ